MLPYIQILENTEKVQLIWDPLPDNDVISFNLYWGVTKDLTNYVTGSLGLPIYGLIEGVTGVLGVTGYSIKREFKDYSLIKEYIPNQRTFDRKYVHTVFEKSDIGMTDDNSFYVIITAAGETGIESEPSQIRLVPFLSDQPAEVGAYNSGIVKSENFSQLVGTAPVRVKFGEDARVVELFNYSDTHTVFVDVSGFDADMASGMILCPKTYYVIDRHIDKDAGFSLISQGAGTDVRIVVHY